MEIEPKIQFDDTQIAFSYKSDKQLKKANFIFTIVNNPFVSGLATSLVKIGLALRLPIKGIIRNTVFDHFCGGETIIESEKTIGILGQYNVGTILDYSVEGAKTEEGFDNTCDQILATFDEARKSEHVPFCVFKTTGMADSDLLAKLNSRENLSDSEKIAFEKVMARVDRICKKAFDFKIPVLIDAEETWIQNPIDEIARSMMRQYNTNETIVFTTYQMYRVDSLANLKSAHTDATENNYLLGVKIVRGAYMEKERERAEKYDYKDPIHPDKGSTDKAFNDALEFCVTNHNRVALVCGSHNEYSNQFLATLLKKYDLNHEDGKIWFSQLLGMSDNISFNLANEGYNVAKYVPYGPVKSVMPYLFRRASENTSVAGQSSRELLLIRKEIKRSKSKAK
jgi:proline dehydrogenase